MNLSKSQKQFWEENGYLILEGFYSDEKIKFLNDYLESCWDNRIAESSEIVIDIFIGTSEEQRIYLKDAPDSARNKPYKINDLFLEDKKIREFVLDNDMAKILGTFLNGRPIICNTLNLEFGSQQEFHTDSLYMTPPRDLNLAAHWIALEDTDPDAGPLRLYPGSHKIRPFLFSSGKMTAIHKEMKYYHDYMRQKVEEMGLKEERFMAKKGDVLIWHSQLFHGGSPINNDSLTRRSIVTHFFKEGDLGGENPEVNAFGLYQKRNKQPVT